MRTLMTCALNGSALLDLDSSIYIEDIRETPAIQQETAKRAHYGTFPLNRPGREGTTITITFMVKEKDRAARSAVIQTVRGWAGQGWLTTNMRSGQRIYVYCTGEPDFEAFDWTARMEIKFSAYGEAFWQEETPVSATASGLTSGSVSIQPNGTQECFLEATITPENGGTLTAATITAGAQSIALTGISATSAVNIYYDELHLLHIDSGGASLLSHRSGADDILLTPGAANTVTLTLDCACTVAVSARGLYK